MPFVYVNGQGDVGVFYEFYSQAKQHNRSNDLYFLNLLTRSTECSHTFDPINPLIGDEESFIALFGAAFGPVLHQLCLCEKEAGHLVDAERLKSFSKPNDLEQMVDQGRYAGAKPALSAYLASLKNLSYASNETSHFSVDACNRFEVDPGVLQHFLNLEMMSNFVDMLDTYPIFSTSPNVDIAKVFKHNKFVVVSLPAIEKDPDALGCMSTLFTCLVSQAIPHFPKASAHPAVVFEATVDFQALGDALLSRFSKANAIFAYTYYGCEGHLSYKTFESITRMAKAVINLKVESMLPQCIKASAIKHGTDGRREIRDIPLLHPGQSISWGSIGIMQRGKMLVLDGAYRFEFRRTFGQRLDEIKLNKTLIEA